MPEKTIENYLVIDWKTGSTRTRKGEPKASSLGTHELVTGLHLDVVIPEVEIDDLEARVEVPKPRVEQSAVDDHDAEDAPEWTDVADEYVDGVIERFGSDWGGWCDTEDKYILLAIQDSPTNPDVREVRQYMHEHVRSRMRELEEEI